MSSNVEALTAPLREPPEKDHGLLGLVLLAQFHGVAADPHQLRHQYSQSGPGLGAMGNEAPGRVDDHEAAVIPQPAAFHHGFLDHDAATALDRIDDDRRQPHGARSYRGPVSPSRGWSARSG